MITNHHCNRLLLNLSLGMTVAAAGCSTGSRGGSEADSSPLALWDTIEVASSQEWFSLPSYMTSQQIVNSEGDTTVLALNYRTNSFDRINLTHNRFDAPIVLNREGPDGITGEIIWFDAFAPDSIVAYDEVKVYLLDTVGRVIDSWQLPGEPIPFVTRNAQLHTAEMHFIPTERSLLYPARKEEQMVIERLDISTGETDEYMMVPGWTGERRGFMVYPNLTFAETDVITAFPYQATVSRISATGDVTSQTAPMKLMTAECGECAPDPNELMWHSLENPHFGEVVWLPEAGLYAQIVLGPTNLEGREDPQKASFDRNFYLRVFDRNLNTVMETDLGAGRFSPYGGWFFTPDGICFYGDNPLTDTSTDENAPTIIYRLTLQSAD